MPLYHVGSRPIALVNAKGKAIKLDQEYVLKALDEEYDPSHPDSNAKIELFDKLEDAKTYASIGVDKDAPEQYAIFEVEVAEGTEFTKGWLTAGKKKLPTKVTTEDAVTLTAVSFPHVNDDEALELDIELAEQEASNEEEASEEASNEEEASEEASNEEEASEEASSEEEEEEVVVAKAKNDKKPKVSKEDEKASKDDVKAKDAKKSKDEAPAVVSFFTKALNFARANWMHFAAPAAIGGGAYLGGAVPAVTSVITQLTGVSVGASALATVAIASLLGATAYAAGYAAYTLGNMAYARLTAKKATPAEQYQQEVAASQAEVAKLADKLGLKKDNSIVVKFAARVKEAREPKFDDKGNKVGTKEIRGGDRLVVLNWQKKQLEHAAKIEKKNDQTAALKKINRKGPSN